MTTTAASQTVPQRLLATDPALRWQVERDLADEPEAVWQATRARIANEGMGAELLSHQDADGQWVGGAYFPAELDWDSEEAKDGQPWTATTWSLNTLREFGLDAAALAGTAEKLAENSRWEYDDLPYWGGEVDACINGFTLANGAWLGADVDGVATWFAEHAMAEGDTRLCEVRHAAEAYLLRRPILYRESTGEPSPWLTFLSLRVLRWWDSPEL